MPCHILCAISFNLMENTNGFIIGAFVKRHKVLSFLEDLKNTFRIYLSRVFIFEIEGNDREYFVTFPAKNKSPYINSIPNSSSFHVKNQCIFSINALNKLIEMEKPCNVENKDYHVDWGKHQSELLTLHDNKLSIAKLNKVRDWTIFFMQ